MSNQLDTQINLHHPSESLEVLYRKFGKDEFGLKIGLFPLLRILVRWRIHWTFLFHILPTRAATLFPRISTRASSSILLKVFGTLLGLTRANSLLHWIQRYDAETSEAYTPLGSHLTYLWLSIPIMNHSQKTFPYKYVEE